MKTFTNANDAIHDNKSETIKPIDKFLLACVLCVTCHVCFIVSVIFAFSGKFELNFNKIAINIFLIIFLLTISLSSMAPKFIKVTIAIWCLYSSTAATYSIILAVTSLTKLYFGSNQNHPDYQFNETTRLFVLLKGLEILFNGSHIALSYWLYRYLNGVASRTQINDGTEMTGHRIRGAIRKMNLHRNAFRKVNKLHEAFDIVV